MTFESEFAQPRLVSAVPLRRSQWV
jgi:hypothetical protein